MDTLQRQLGRPGQDEDSKTNATLRRFIWTEERYQRSEMGRVRQLENIHHVSMDDPVHEDDEERLEALMEEYERQAQEAASRHQHRRKQILPPQEKAPSKTISTLEPQNTVGGHRKIRHHLESLCSSLQKRLLLQRSTLGRSQTSLLLPSLQCQTNHHPKNSAANGPKYWIG